MRTVLLLFITLFLLVAVCIVYFVYYKSTINKRLENGVTNGKKMISPLWMAIIFLIIALIVLIVVPMLLRMGGTVSDINEIPEKYWNASYDYQVYTPDEVESGFLGNYSIDENTGYERYEEVDGNIRFTYFISREAYDSYHPAFIIYAEYVGTEDIKNLSMGFYGEFFTSEGQDICGTGASGGEFSDYVCVVGNPSIDCGFSLDFYLVDPIAEKKILDEQMQDDSESDTDYLQESLNRTRENAAAYGTLRIDLNIEEM